MLASRREAAGVSVEEAASRVGMPARVLRAIENGEELLFGRRELVLLLRIYGADRIDYQLLDEQYERTRQSDVSPNATPIALTDIEKRMHQGHLEGRYMMRGEWPPEGTGVLLAIDAKMRLGLLEGCTTG
jgi:transcriptional regulator with XRE-family HTH domain